MDDAPHPAGKEQAPPSGLEFLPPLSLHPTPPQPPKVTPVNSEPAVLTSALLPTPSVLQMQVNAQRSLTPPASLGNTGGKAAPPRGVKRKSVGDPPMSSLGRTARDSANGASSRSPSTEEEEGEVGVGEEEDEEEEEGEEEEEEEEAEEDIQLRWSACSEQPPCRVVDPVARQVGGEQAGTHPPGSPNINTTS